MIQLYATILVVVIAIIYALWRIYQAFVDNNDPCAGCQGCSLKDAYGHGKYKKSDCIKKKP